MLSIPPTFFSAASARSSGVSTEATINPEFSMNPQLSAGPASLLHGLLFCVVFCGCSEGNQPANPATPKSVPPTNQIGEYDPNAGLQVVTPDAQVTDPITGPLEILKNVRVQLPTLQIEHALNLYNAAEGNYPKSHDDFMRDIIQANRLVLPQLPADLLYQYDVTNHKLVIVRAADGKIVE